MVGQLMSPILEPSLYLQNRDIYWSPRSQTSRFFWGNVESRVYVDTWHTIATLKVNATCIISEIEPVLYEKDLQKLYLQDSNTTQRRGCHLPDIIFRINCQHISMLRNKQPIWFQVKIRSSQMKNSLLHKICQSR